MGFEGLLYLVDKGLSKDLCYWLMTRIDPMKELFRAANGRDYKLSKDQVRWILGIPKGDKVVPRRVRDEEMKRKVRDIEKNFGGECEARLKTSEKVIKHKRIPVTSALIERAKESWGVEQEAEFKTVFLILALHLVLCPTQSHQLESDLVPALTCAVQAKNYDWCGLVLEKFFKSCCRFKKKFSANGYAKGFGGCSIFLAIFYLDRLDRNPVMWSRWPRIKVWTKAEMVKARDEDSLAEQGDFGNLGFIDVDYGKKHPWEARDTGGTSVVEKGLNQDIESLQSKEEEAILGRNNGLYKRKNRKRRRISAMYPELLMFKKAKRKGLQGGVPNALAQACRRCAEGGCPIEGEGRNEDGGNGDDGYISLAEEVCTPVATDFAVVTEPVGESGDKMPSPLNEVTVTSLTTSHGCSEHNSMEAPPCLTLSCNTLMASAFVHGISEMDAKSTNFNYKMNPPRSNSLADHSLFPSQNNMKGKSKLPQILNGSVEENGEGILPCLLSSCCNVMEDSGFVDCVEKLYIEDIPSSENNNCLNISLVDNNEIIRYSSLGIAFEKAIREMDLQMEQVKKCREKCVKMSSNRSVDSVAEMHMEIVPYCDKNTNLEISHEVNVSIPSQITHQRGIIEVSSSTNTLMADIDQHKMVHEDISCINAGKSSKHSEGAQPRGETEMDATNDQGKAAKVNEKLVNGSCDGPVIIIADEDSDGEKKNDDFDPFKVVGSQLEDRISKLEKIVSRKLASNKLAFKTTIKKNKKKLAFKTEGKKLLGC
ncbi:uncharacterized protein LOC110720992 [Chenopodium quinoa]|uniref:uncharacterized protein LOC110720992 n=1 Tax=Chenopodium quinoa TaxID=63459 RepID=UPI000B7987DD|nr:uncharacterized protein LOC110720992 [Chenopodium quinoa]